MDPDRILTSPRTMHWLANNRARSEAMASYLVRTRFDYDEHRVDVLARDQLHRELDEEVMRNYSPQKPDGTIDCPLYTKLPTEVRHHIFSFLVKVPESIHLHPVKGNSKLGFRLSRCGEQSIDLRTGKCRCERGLSYIHPPPAPPAFLDTELLLLSKTIRREALDLIFSRNHFTFTTMRDLTLFTERFESSAAMLQHVRIFERCTDGCHGSHRNKQVHKARALIGDLQSLTLHLYLDHYSVFEEPYADGFLAQLLPLHFGHPQTIGRLTIDVQTARPVPASMPLTVSSVKAKLVDVFNGKWQSVDMVPMAEPPKRRVPQSERQPEVRRGLLVLGD